MALDYSNNKAILERVRGQLREYQANGIAFGIRRRHVLFDVRVGYGKTVMGLTTLFAFRPQKVLVLCSSTSLGNIIHEIAEWFPEYADPKEFVIIGTQGKSATRRKKLWALDKTFYISTKETFNLDQDEALRWNFDAYLFDEIQDIPKHTTKTYKKLEQGLRDIPVKIMLSGTWFKRHAGNGWRQLHMLERKVFSSYWRFVNTFCVVIDGPFGKDIVTSKNADGFAKTIDLCVYRYHVKDGSVPDSVRKFMWVDRDQEQEKLYKSLAEDMYAELENGTLIISQVSLVNFIRFRQIQTCPAILDPSLGFGSALGQLIHFLKEHEDDPEEQHCVLFSPFRPAVAIFAEELRKRGYKVFEIMSGMSGSEIYQKTVDFKAAKGTKSVAISTINFSKAYHLGTSTRSHFIGITTDMEPLMQAEARLARADSDLDKMIVHRYWLYNNSIDIEHLDMLRGRAKNVRRQFASYDAVKDLLYGGT